TRICSQRGTPTAWPLSTRSPEPPTRHPLVGRVTGGRPTLWTTPAGGRPGARESPPMTTRPHPSTPVSSDVELTERWRALLQLDGPPVRRSLFLAWLRTDGTTVPLLIPVEDLPLEPDRAALANLVQLHVTVAESEDVAPGE